MSDNNGSYPRAEKEKEKEEKMINEKFTSLDIFVLFAVNFPVHKHIMFHHRPQALRVREIVAIVRAIGQEKNYICLMHRKRTSIAVNY